MSVYKNKFLGKTEYSITSQITLRLGVIFLISAVFLWITLTLKLGYEITIVLIGLEVVIAVIFWQLKLMGRTTEVLLYDFFNFLRGKNIYYWKKDINKFIYNVLISEEPITKKVKERKELVNKEEIKKIDSWEYASDVQEILENIISDEKVAKENFSYLTSLDKSKNKKLLRFNTLGREITITNIILIFIFISASVLSILYYKNYYNIRSYIDLYLIKNYILKILNR
ncbi:MAG: hypothetical protein KKC53_03925 [Actinobacteria bacterium]|nr:hypothetical protein [Actinomycetota bacterium]